MQPIKTPVISAHPVIPANNGQPAGKLSPMHVFLGCDAIATVVASAIALPIIDAGVTASLLEVGRGSIFAPIIHFMGFFEFMMVIVAVQAIFALIFICLKPCIEPDVNNNNDAKVISAQSSLPTPSAPPAPSVPSAEFDLEPA